MDDNFRAYVRTVRNLFCKLVAMPPIPIAMLPHDLPRSGVYVISDGRRPVYVGRSDGLRSRIMRHGRPQTPPKQTGLAFRMAQTSLRRKRAIAAPRTQLSQSPAFLKEFEIAKKRIQAMNVRCVGVDDPIYQSLLEIYAAVTLKTRYNDFKNH